MAGVHLQARAEDLEDSGRRRRRLLRDHRARELQDLFEAARKRHEDVSFTTVYRTMKLLDEAGLADARKFGEGKSTLYEVAAGRSHHDHLIYDSCGRIVEFVDDEVEELQAAIARKHGFTLRRHRHDLYGFCANCRR